MLVSVANKPGALENSYHIDVSGSLSKMQISVKLNFPICFPFLAPRGKRGWKTFYAVLKGTVLYLQKVKVETYERKPTELNGVRFRQVA